MNQLLRVGDIARLLNVQEARVYALVAEKKLPVKRVGALLRFDLGEVMASVSEPQGLATDKRTPNENIVRQTREAPQSNP